MTAPALTIRMTKRRGKPALLACVRRDGSSTVPEMAPGAAHDLGHYAVETSLGLRRAFFGLIAGGMDIAAFNVQGATTRLQIPQEAVLVEFIVGLLQVEMLSGAPTPDFNGELARMMAGSRKPLPPPPRITDEQLAAIRVRLAGLVHRWHSLPPGGTLELVFPDTAG